MLHGTNEKVRGFKISGTTTKIDDKTISYKVKVEWHDIIDPNFQYDDDVLYSNMLDLIYDPKDYNIHISWDVEYKIILPY